MRIFALSDLHADHAANARWLHALSHQDYQSDTLVVAGDVSDDLDSLRRVLTALQAKFARVTFVPGNHELWVRRGEAEDSIEKFHRVLDVATSLGVHVEPARHEWGGAAVWTVPLFGWYTLPEEGSDTLHLPGASPDEGIRAWLDFQFTRWTSLDGQSPAAYFLGLNASRVARHYDAPVLSFSHFLPRWELMLRDSGATMAARPPGAARRFNFSRVAGSTGLERQLRQMRAKIHVYGHQHRNRRRVLDGVLYLSHCLGYPRERRDGSIGEVGAGPLHIWPLDEATGA